MNKLYRDVNNRFLLWYLLIFMYNVYLSFFYKYILLLSLINKYLHLKLLLFSYYCKIFKIDRKNKMIMFMIITLLMRNHND